MCICVWGGGGGGRGAGEGCEEQWLGEKVTVQFVSYPYSWRCVTLLTEV